MTDVVVFRSGWERTRLLYSEETDLGSRLVMKKTHAVDQDHPQHVAVIEGIDGSGQQAWKMNLLAGEERSERLGRRMWTVRHLAPGESASDFSDRMTRARERR